MLGVDLATFAKSAFLFLGPVFLVVMLSRPKRFEQEDTRKQKELIDELERLSAARGQPK